MKTSTSTTEPEQVETGSGCVFVPCAVEECHVSVCVDVDCGFEAPMMDGHEGELLCPNCTGDAISDFMKKTVIKSDLDPIPETFGDPDSLGLIHNRIHEEVGVGRPANTLRQKRQHDEWKKQNEDKDVVEQGLDRRDSAD